MKTTFLDTHKKLTGSKQFAFVDRDYGQLDVYDKRPAVKFPCALIKVNQPNRENLHPFMQRVSETIQIRLGFEKNIAHHNLQSAVRLEKALEYYDWSEAIKEMFQGLKLGDTDKWICTSVIDEERADFDILKLTFTTRRTETFD
jgi:hypothetical protein